MPRGAVPFAAREHAQVNTLAQQGACLMDCNLAGAQFDVESWAKAGWLRGAQMHGVTVSASRLQPFASASRSQPLFPCLRISLSVSAAPHALHLCRDSC